MPRRSILSAAERESLLALPDTKDVFPWQRYKLSSTAEALQAPQHVEPVCAALCAVGQPQYVLTKGGKPFQFVTLVMSNIEAG